MKYNRVDFGGHNTAVRQDSTLAKIQLVKAVAGSAEHVAQIYGLKINPRTHRAVCPFHTHGSNPDENLSFHGEGFRCFVCGASGSSLDYVQQLFGLSTITDAARRLDADLHLGVFDAGPQVRRSLSQQINNGVSSTASEDEDAQHRLEYLEDCVFLGVALYSIWWNALDSQRYEEEAVIVDAYNKGVFEGIAEDAREARFEAAMHARDEKW